MTRDGPLNRWDTYGATMTRSRTGEMDRDAIDDFLHRRGTGVLSLADGNDAYGVPVSYAYDASVPAVYLRLGAVEEGTKGSYIDAADRVSLVVYDRADGRWRSVILGGRLEVVDPDEIDRSLAEALRTGELPVIGLYKAVPADVEFSLYRLRIEDLSGRVEGPPEPSEG